MPRLSLSICFQDMELHGELALLLNTCSVPVTLPIWQCSSPGVLSSLLWILFFNRGHSIVIKSCTELISVLCLCHSVVIELPVELIPSVTCHLRLSSTCQLNSLPSCDFVLDGHRGTNEVFPSCDFAALGGASERSSGTALSPGY
jgi:hypothetical protein